MIKNSKKYPTRNYQNLNNESLENYNTPNNKNKGDLSIYGSKRKIPIAKNDKMKMNHPTNSKNGNSDSINDNNSSLSVGSDSEFEREKFTRNIGNKDNVSKLGKKLKDHVDKNKPYIES